MMSRSKRKTKVLKFPPRKTSTDQDFVLTSEERTLLLGRTSGELATRFWMNLGSEGWLRGPIQQVSCWSSDPEVLLTRKVLLTCSKMVQGCSEELQIPRSVWTWWTSQFWVCWAPGLGGAAALRSLIGGGFHPVPHQTSSSFGPRAAGFSL